MSIKIDKTVPIPTRVGRSGFGETAMKMEPNDSVFVTSLREMTGMRNALIYHGFKCVTRKEGKGWRIWKAKREAT
jgi:hypothetical protein